jgi:endonuclease/exonuclease/phosphatase family metal-dependent hydrolase
MLSMSKILKGFASIIALIQLIACQSSTPHESAVDTSVAEITIFSFNIAGDSKHWEGRKLACREVIAAHKPDIIGFQELLPVNLRWALENFPTLRWYGVTIEGSAEAYPDDVEGESCRILYDANRFSVDEENSGAFWFSGTPESSSEGWEDLRYCVYVRLIDKRDGEGLYFYNTHWSYSSQESRDNAARIMNDHIAARCFSDDPVVVTGDFNARTEDTGIQMLHQKMTPVLHDRVDWIFARVDKYEGVRTEVLHEVDGTALSDHNVLKAKLRMNP